MGTRLRKYGVQATIDFEVYGIDGVDLKGDWVPAQVDCEIMKDGGASTLCDNTATDEGITFSIVLTATEMQFARGVLKIQDAATKVILDTVVHIETYGNASAQHAFDLDAVNRGTDSAALASNYTAARAGYLDELAAANLPTDVAACNTVTPDAAGTAPTAVEINAEVDTALSDINLDHLMKTATAGADMTAEVPDNTVLSRMMANGDTSAFVPSTDGLQPIRDRGDAAWAGAPESVSGTIAVATADTIFDLTASVGTLSTVDDTYNNMIVCILDNSGSVYETARITDYDGTGVKRITIDHELTFPVQDGVDTFVIYRAAYAPVGAASITEGDKDDIADKVYDELVVDHQTAGSGGYHLKRAGQRY